MKHAKLVLLAAFLAMAAWILLATMTEESYDTPTPLDQFAMVLTTRQHNALQVIRRAFLTRVAKSWLWPVQRDVGILKGTCFVVPDQRLYACNNATLGDIINKVNAWRQVWVTGRWRVINQSQLAEAMRRVPSLKPLGPKGMYYDAASTSVWLSSSVVNNPGSLAQRGFTSASALRKTLAVPTPITTCELKQLWLYACPQTYTAEAAAKPS